VRWSVHEEQLWAKTRITPPLPKQFDNQLVPLRSQHLEAMTVLRNGGILTMRQNPDCPDWLGSHF
jgi:phage terminase small subunit